MFDITTVQNFYASALGERLSKDLQNLLRLWSRASENDLIATLGYGFPYVESFHKDCQNCIALMPAQMGAVLDQKLPQCLVHPHLLPLADSALHSLLMVHALEHSIDPRAVLREAWRVLQDDGDLIIIVPYRQGLWARLASQPFGYGTPYNRGQLQSQLAKAGFNTTSVHRRIYFPPSHNSTTQKLFALITPIIQTVLPMLAGILIVRARKSLLQPTHIGQRKTLSSSMGKIIKA